MTAHRWKRADATWMHKARVGVMIHYLADRPSATDPVDLTVDEWNRRVDRFDVPGLVHQLRQTGAGYLIFTIGQCSGFFCSPNQAYDGRTGITPSRLSRRDLVGEIANALTKVGIRLIAYLPGHAPANHHEAVEALNCIPPWHAPSFGIESGTYPNRRPVDERLTEFQKHWEAIVREWSLRWGHKVSGWWIDGCYYADRMYRHDDAPNFRSFAEALKAGNPESLVAFNPGVLVPIVSVTPYEDYTAGESNALPTPDRDHPMGRLVDGAQLHVLSFLGQTWCVGDQPRYPDDLVIAYTRYVNTLGGAVTWDVPVDSDGKIPPPFMQQLRRVGEACGGVGRSH